MKVILRAYDITRGMAATLSSTLLNQHIEGIWHTSVFVYNHEYFFGGGIQKYRANRFEFEQNLKPLRIVDFGLTNKSQDEFEKYLTENILNFTMATYDLLHWNCNHFTNFCLSFLVNKTLPTEFIDQIQVLKSNPLAAAILQLIQTSQVQVPQQCVTSTAQLEIGPTTPIDRSQGLSCTAFGRAVIKLLELPEKENVFNVLQQLNNILNKLITKSTDPTSLVVANTSNSLSSFFFDTFEATQCLLAIGFQRRDTPEFVMPTLNAHMLRDFVQYRKIATALLESTLCIPESMFSLSDTNQISSSLESNYSTQLQHLQEMGFTDRTQNIRVLQESNGDINRALDILHGG